MPASAPKAVVHFHSLGCPKNLLDTEVMLGSLAVHGYAIAERLEDADVAVVNTCSFIESAREESIQAVLEVAERKGPEGLRALIVTGCLPQRYGAELARELPEVDALVGTGSFQEIAQILDETLAGQSRGIYVEAGRTHLYDDRSPRVLVGQGHTAYLKIAEGCDRSCSFCAFNSVIDDASARSSNSSCSATSSCATLRRGILYSSASSTTASAMATPGETAIPRKISIVRRRSPYARSGTVLGCAAAPSHERRPPCPLPREGPTGSQPVPLSRPPASGPASPPKTRCG